MSIRQTVVASLIGASMLFTPLLAQAKNEEQMPKKEVGAMCMFISYTAHEALSERFANKSEKVAKQNLYKKFVDGEEGEAKKFFAGLVDMSIKDAYKINASKVKNVKDKEQALKEYAVGAFSGCVEEMGYKLSDFSEADFE